jgi:hypothetical protein
MFSAHKQIAIRCAKEIETNRSWRSLGIRNHWHCGYRIGRASKCGPTSEHNSRGISAGGRKLADACNNKALEIHLGVIGFNIDVWVVQLRHRCCRGNLICSTSYYERYPVLLGGPLVRRESWQPAFRTDWSRKFRLLNCKPPRLRMRPSWTSTRVMGHKWQTFVRGFSTLLLIKVHPTQTIDASITCGICLRRRQENR